MNTTQRIIKYFAIFLALSLVVGIFFTAVQFLRFASHLLGLNDAPVLSENLEVISSEADFESISELDIELEYTNLQIKSGESFKIETNNPKIKLEQKKTRISVDEKSISGYLENASTLVITLPSELEIIDNTDIESGAGNVEIDGLKTEKLSLSLGAGKTVISNVYVSKRADIEGGAGTFEISESVINNIDYEVGVGKVDISAQLTGDGKIKGGVGSMDVELKNSLEEYTVYAETGIGSVKVDGNTLKNGAVYGSGENRLEIKGGVGSIDVH